MKLSAVKQALKQVNQVQFQLPNGAMVPAHFHVTEVGSVSKKFIDCGGTVREEHAVNFQLWQATDYDHRLGPEKLINIIELSENTLDLEDHEVEVEYQEDTIGRYGLEFDGEKFLLQSKQTACLAPDQCGIPAQKKPRIRLNTLGQVTNSSCDPSTGCC
ncbi:DUF6428 family protein [Persicobacter diffluens]|uniref:Uncharacterized protein n=1 Tax=Persicobacter diffluens TaxID=981 RepID=A0AAN5AM20_9BACT|nr:hypothetical protein PEDI_39090 [Persicobacter diffluens]